MRNRCCASGGDVGLPQVLEVVVVRRGAAALDFGDDPAARAQGVDEVGTRVGDKALAGREDDFLPEAEVLAQHRRDDRLDGAGLGAVDVD